MLPRPAATIHNPFVGNHPFAGHGPVVRLPTAGGASPTSLPYGTGFPYSGDLNFTLTYAVTGTTPPVANATATIDPAPIYIPVLNTTSSSNATSSSSAIPCDQVPELIDSSGNFLPGDLQPKYNGSSNCIPSSSDGSEDDDEDVDVVEIDAPPERVEITGHVVGSNEIVEVEVTPLLNATSSWNNTANGDYGTYYGVGFTNSDSAGPSVTAASMMISSLPETVPSSTPTATATSVVGHKKPTSLTPGFTGPKVRRALAEKPGLSGEEHLEGLADLAFD